MMEERKLRSLISGNPVAVLFLGACPIAAASPSVLSALGMAGAVMAVLIVSSLLISLFKKIIPASVKMPASLLITAGVVSIVQLLMNALLPNIFHMLGVYLAAAAVSVFIFAEAEEADARGVGSAVVSAFLDGLGFAVVIFVTAAFREVFGAASFAGFKLAFLQDFCVPVLLKTSGGLLIFAFVLAAVAAIGSHASAENKGFAFKAAGLCGFENSEKEDFEQ